ncbi:hypothetical protein [Methanococcoides seepicolus]|uniref:Uncharacterized protein n=1 Tax=Methanococcoides seepicolus TaxID=2828780 RepID=A0A9E5DDN0_9EURY|nr:hypothetical protein [Methanococcoides seepicolus]MCM1987729.1 hypothetical protein [Methanococcoides seepicolus]
MSVKKITMMLLVLAMVGIMVSPLTLASQAEVTGITRSVPANFATGEEIEISLTIEGNAPIMVGLVENIPEGFSFPKKDSDISDAKHFKVDRKTGKIVFSVMDEKEISYKVIAPSSAKGDFTGYWVDLLVQTPELNEGKERWKPVIDPTSSSPNKGMSSFASDQENIPVSTEPKTPGFGAVFSSVAILACLLISKNNLNGGNNK